MESNIIHSVSRIDCLHLVVRIVLVGENIAPIIHFTVHATRVFFCPLNRMSCILSVVLEEVSYL